MHKLVAWNNREKINVDLLINATPLGMFGKYSRKYVLRNMKKKNFNYIYDLPVNHEKNQLFVYAKKHRIKYIAGLESSFYQSAKQFEIYNKIKLNEKKIKKKLLYNF